MGKDERGEGERSQQQPGIEFLPKDGAHVAAVVLALSLYRSLSACHMVKIWAKWGEHLARPPGMPRLLPQISTRLFLLRGRLEWNFSFKELCSIAGSVK